MVAALSWLTATLPKWHKGDRDNLPYFGVGVFLDLLGIPMVCDIGIALYSKMLPDRVQGVGHAVRRYALIILAALRLGWIFPIFLKCFRFIRNQEDSLWGVLQRTTGPIWGPWSEF